MLSSKMGKIDLKDVEKLRDTVVSSTRKGFGYYFSNIGLIILVLCGCYIFANPEILINPAEFFAKFTASSIYSLITLVFIIFGVFLLGSRLRKYSNDETAKVLIKTTEEHKEMQEEEHRLASKKRIENIPIVNGLLKDMLINLDADRATICEMHNGTNNFDGLPFVYMSMTFEEVSNNVDYISDEYPNFNMTKFPFLAAHYRDNIWVGSREEIEKLDPHLSAKLMYNDTNYLGAILIHGEKHAIGMLVVSFKNPTNKTVAEIKNELLKTSQKLGVILSK